MRRLRLFSRWLLIGTVSLYTASIVALVLLWVSRPQFAWWVALTNVVAAPLFLPLVLLIPLVWIVRSWWLSALVSLLAMLFLLLFGAHFLPQTRPASSDRVTLRIVTLNQWFSNPHVDAVITAIREQHADIVAIQELSTPVEEAIKQQLRAEYPYQILAPAEFDYGGGIISRYPLRELPKNYSFSGEIAVAQVADREVTIINVHLPAPMLQTVRFGREQPWRQLRRPVGYNATLRTNEYPGFLDAIDATRGPLIVLGDHNTSDREEAYTQLATRLHDAWRETNWGFGFTFPNDKRVGSLRLPFPLVRIDYIWSKNGLAPLEAHVVCGRSGSDHCLLVADLRFEP